MVLNGNNAVFIIEDAGGAFLNLAAGTILIFQDIAIRSLVKQAIKKSWPLEMIR
jgi:hypothetical protein